MPSLTERFDAVFFDAGDTLLYIPQAAAIMRRYLAERGLDCEERRIGELFTESYRLLYYGKRSRGDEVCSPESERSFWKEVYKRVLLGLGVAEHREERTIEQWSHEWFDIFTSPEPYELFDDVADTLERLSREGLRLGVVSNFAPTLRTILRHKSILHYFDPVIVSTEVGLEKPNPAIFRLALERSGLKAERVLHVGDHDVNDIWAARQAGITAVKVLRYEYHAGEGIRSLHELLDRSSFDACEGVARS